MKPEPEYKKTASTRNGGRQKVYKSYPSDCYNPRVDLDTHLLPEGYGESRATPYCNEYIVHVHKRRAV